MTAHLIWATSTALIAIAIAWLLRGRSAALRHGMLLAAVLSFVVPTPWLGTVGDKLAGCLPVKPSFPVVAPGSVTRLAAYTVTASHVESHAVRKALFILWAMVLVLLIATWLRRLLRRVPSIRAANQAEVAAMVGASERLGFERSVELRITTSDRVPGACGIYRPCVVLPDLLSEQLSAAELQAIMAHELAHLARRDNLSAAVVRIVVSVFWFHPLLWWIERRMLAEREAACDELVLAHGAEAEDYVSAILKVCRMSFAGITGYAGATGSNLNHRMEQIMVAHAVRPSSKLLRAIPAAVLVLACILPVSERVVRGQAPAPAQSVTHSANNDAVQKAYGCLQKGELQEAEKLFRQLYTSDPEDTRGVIGLAETYMAENRSDEATGLMQDEMASHPGRTDFPLFLGNLYFRSQRYDQAIAEFQKALDNGKNLSAEARSQLLYRIGETYRQKGDLDEATRFFKASAELNPKSTTSLLNEAMIFDGTGRKDQAAKAYEQILKIQPDNAVALNNLAYILAGDGRDYDRALALAERAAEAVKKSNGSVPADFSDTLGWVLLKKNQPEEAAKAFRSALKSDPDNATFHYHLGLALLPMGERSAAIEEFKAALEHNPPNDVEAPVRELLQKLAP